MKFNKTALIAPILFGIGVITVSHLLWIFVLRSNGYPWALAGALKSSPFVASLIVAYMVPNKKVCAGMSMAPITAVISCAMNIVYSSMGLPTDFPGLSGAVIVLGVALVSGTFLCMAGTSVGYFLSSKTKRK